MTFSTSGFRFLAEGTYTPPVEAHTILNTLAWCVTAGGVFGLLVVGINMAVQINRGEPGEGSAHFRGAFIVAIACLIGTTAGPLVSFLGDLSLQAPPK
ncbi:hypothetical protein [Streptomyces fumanus]|uniref:hypothetical protein n=1 Tax=Streptomyces fumanus TaxID=67302 RepID=UPI0033D77585